MAKINAKLLVGLIVVAASLPYIHGRKYMKEKPSFLKPCALKKPEFFKCYRSNVQQLLLEYGDGIPGLSSVGSFNPVKLKRVKIQHNQFKINIRNVTVHGLRDTLIKRVQYSLKNTTFAAKVHVPRMRVEGRYKTDGYLMFIPMNGRGNLTVEANNTDLFILFKMKLVDDVSVNRTFQELQLVQSKIRNIGDFRINLQNLFNGNKQLEEDTNDMLNTNWRDVLDVLQPTLEDAVNAILFARFKKILHYIPAKYFVNDLPSAKEFYARKTLKM